MLYNIIGDNNTIIIAAEEFCSPWNHFDGLGFDESIPAHLRLNGKIQNLSLSQKQLVMILNELWDAKNAYDTQISNALESTASTTVPNPVEMDTGSLDPTTVTVAAAPASPKFVTFVECYLMVSHLPYRR
jgi:hypothetical protein